MAISSWWSLPGHSIHPQQGSASVQIHKAASRDKVSKLTFWLCNYLFSYNCRFSCIIRLINIKLLLMLPRILNDAVGSQKGGEWYAEKSGGREERCVVGSGARHAEALGLVYSANPEYLWWLSQSGIIHCNGTMVVANSNFSWRTIHALTVLQREQEGAYKPPVPKERGQISARCSFLEKT